MSRCFTKFPIGGLGEPNIYHQSVCFTRNGKIVESVWLWRISGSYSQEMMRLFLQELEI